MNPEPDTHSQQFRTAKPPLTTGAEPGWTPVPPKERSAWQAGNEPVPGYRLVRMLGRGGFGEVWLARGPGDFAVALKYILLDSSGAALEARALALMKEIRHPHLMPLFGAWEVGGCLIMAMELAEGSLLDRLEEARHRGENCIPRDQVLEWMLEAAKGLDYLNEPHPGMASDLSQGIQHRDIKPQNLLLVGGSVKVADFGLAKVMAQAMASHSGSMTLPYAAPEFFSGKTAATSDQYSLAVTYCHLRGGRLPFVGSPTEIMAGHLMNEPDLSMLPEAERPAVARALAKQPSERWPDCKTFVQALQRGASVMHDVATLPREIRQRPDLVVVPAADAKQADKLDDSLSIAEQALVLRHKRRCLSIMALVMTISLVVCGIASRAVSAQTQPVSTHQEQK